MPGSDSMNPAQEQMDAFRSRGIIRIKRAVPRSYLAPVRQFLDSELRRLNVSERSVPRQLRSVPIFQQTEKLGRMIRQDQGLDRLIAPGFVRLAEALAQSRLESSSRPQILLSPPHKRPWSLANLNWHVDISSAPTAPIPGVQIFVLIDDVESQGGATLALAGTHRLASASQASREHPELRRLCSRDAGSTSSAFHARVMGHEISLVEMSGKAGDVFLMDMRVLHSPSVNASRRIRMMMTNRFFRVDK